MSNAPSPQTRALAALILFLAEPRLLLDYLGSLIDDIRDRRNPEDKGRAP